MKKGYINILILLFGAIALAGCNENEEILPQTGELVPVTIQLPGAYNTIKNQNATSRAAQQNNELNGIPILNLKEGSTLWLFAKTEKGDPKIQGYVVKNSGGGVQSLYPCGQTQGGDSININAKDISTTPLYLEAGVEYTFSAISPAKTIYKGNKFRIGNEEYVVATNDAWTQTKSTTLTINGKEGIVVLNPLMQIGARMTFTISKSDRISSLSVIQSGIEIDGLGEEPTTADYTIGTDLKTNIGDSYNRLFVPSSTFTKTDKGLKSDIGIRPVDCRSTVVYIIANLMVNGTPVQYTFAVKDRLFKPGYSYDYTINIDIKDGITIANWQENSWSTEVHPQ